MRLSSGQSQRSDQGPNMLMSSVPSPVQKTRRSVGADARRASPRGTDAAQGPGARAAGPLREPSARRARLPPTAGGLIPLGSAWLPLVSSQRSSSLCSVTGATLPAPALLEQAARQPLA